MINFNQIIQPIEKAILLWTHIYPLSAPLTTITDLTNGQFFILHLSKIEGFKMVEPCNFRSYVGLSVGEKIGRMKVIGRSIIKYYRCELMKDLASPSFNYVGMCTENKQQLMKLIIIFMAIIVTNESALEEVESFIANSKQQSLAYLNIMLEYAKKMNYSQQPSQSSPLKQKRLITKLQILEDQIQFYQGYAKQLQTKLAQLYEDVGRHQSTIREYEKSKEGMLARIEELQVKNEQMVRQVNKKSNNQALLTAKLLKNRQLAEQSIERLLKDIDRSKDQIVYYKECLMKYEQVQAVNKHLTNTNNDIMKELQVLKAKIDKQSNTLQNQEIELSTLAKVNNSLTLQNDGLKVKIQFIEKSFANNRELSYSPQQKSIAIHHPLDLSTSQNNFTWLNFQPKEDESLNESLTMTLRSNTSLIEQPKKPGFTNKQNQMGSANMEDGELNKIGQQQSFELNMEHINLLIKSKKERDLELQFAIQSIVQIYDYMQELRKQLNKYKVKEARQLSRALQFKHQVNNMFR